MLFEGIVNIVNWEKNESAVFVLMMAFTERSFSESVSKMHPTTNCYSTETNL